MLWFIIENNHLPPFPHSRPDSFSLNHPEQSKHTACHDTHPRALAQPYQPMVHPWFLYYLVLLLLLPPLLVLLWALKFALL